MIEKFLSKIIKMIERYNEDYFYFSNKDDNWWEHSIFKQEKFIQFKDKVYWYFDNELNEKLLVELLCDDDGNDFEYNGVPVAARLDLLIFFGYKSGEGVSNVAVNLMEWLTKNNFIE